MKSDDPGDRSSRDTGEWHDRRPAEISDLGVDNNQAQVTYGERVVMVTTLTTTAKNVERNGMRRRCVGVDSSRDYNTFYFIFIILVLDTDALLGCVFWTQNLIKLYTYWKSYLTPFGVSDDFPIQLKPFQQWLPGLWVKTILLKLWYQIKQLDSSVLVVLKYLKSASIIFNMNIGNIVVFYWSQLKLTLNVLRCL